MMGSGGVGKSMVFHNDFYFCQSFFEIISQIKKINDLRKIMTLYLLCVGTLPIVL